MDKDPCHILFVYYFVTLPVSVLVISWEHAYLKRSHGHRNLQHLQTAEKT